MARTKTTRARETPERLDKAIATARSKVARMDSLPRADRGASAMRTDGGWGSIMTGLGTNEHDRRNSFRIMARRNTYTDLAAMYRNDDMIARIVDRPAEDMTREGWSIGVGEDEETANAIAERLDELGVAGVICDALKKRGWSGGSGIFLGAVDGAGDPSLPLNENALQDLAFLQVFDCRELYPASYYADPFAPKYGLPATYFVRPQVGIGSVYGAKVTSGGGVGSLRVVHESRIVRFEGVVVNRLQQRETLSWGDAPIERSIEVVRDFQTSHGTAAALVLDFAQAIFKMKGLADAVAAGDADAVNQRMILIQRQRSAIRAVLLDEEEEFKREATPLGGLAEVLIALCVRLAATADIPVTLLLGQSPAGLNATGASDLRNYYDRIRARQGTDVRPALNRIVKLLLKSKRGPTNGKEPKKWKIEFAPLWTPTEAEESTIRLNDANADKARVEAQILTPEEIAIARYSGSKYGREIRVDVDGRRAFLAANPVDEARLEEPKEPEPEPVEPGKKPAAA